MADELELNSLAKLSAVLGLSEATIARYRTGEIKPPRSVQMHMRALKHLPAWRRIYLTRMGRKIAMQAKRERDRAANS